MLKLLKKTERNAVAFHRGELTIIVLPKGKEDEPRYRIYDVMMRRTEIVLGSDVDRGFAFCCEDDEIAKAKTYFLVNTMGEC